MRLPHMRYPVVRKTLYSETMFAKKVKSLHQHTCAQIFMDGVRFMHVYPIKKKSEAGLRLEKLITTLKMIPETIMTDGGGRGNWR
jgi:hypothetical protein